MHDAPSGPDAALARSAQEMLSANRTNTPRSSSGTMHVDLVSTRSSAMVAARYTLFLGYDPGGKGKHGVAAARIAGDGDLESGPETCVLRDAEEVCRWVTDRHNEAAGLGIDTLLAWSRKGKRECDDALRRRYPEHRKTVIAQNSLYSSMTVNGVLVAQHGRCLRLSLFESHPKLVRHLCQDDPRAEKLLDWQASLPDHEADALVAAWCASRWVFECWQTDLYTIKDELFFPAGTAAYPWPDQAVADRSYDVCTVRRPTRP